MSLAHQQTQISFQSESFKHILCLPHEIFTFEFMVHHRMLPHEIFTFEFMVHLRCPFFGHKCVGYKSQWGKLEAQSVLTTGHVW